MPSAAPHRPADYRADIDGLRAVAVLLVAFFHARFEAFQGGFIGVDVFFVISGYLITRIIVREIEAGRFSIWRFYERRIRRIAPALAVVVIAVCLFTLLFKTPREANMFGESVTFVLLMISNFFFYAETGYFGVSAERFALLHTWSLAVEEQFYIVLPPLLLLLFAKGRRAAQIGVGALLLASLVASLIVIQYDPRAAFFLSPFRFWELAVGSALALGMAPAFASGDGRARALREGAAALGVLLIVVPAVAYQRGADFPGWKAIPPVLGTALLIHANAAGATLMGRALSWRPIVFVGLCSYSFYLWHWPALSFAAYALIRPLTALEAGLILVLAFALSVASLYLVERPFRRTPGHTGAGETRAARGVSTRGVLASFAGFFVAVMALGLALQASKGWHARFPELTELFSEKANRYGLRVNTECQDAKAALVQTDEARIGHIFCRFGDPDATPDFVVWGDSHATANWSAFADAATATGRAGYLAMYGVCPPISNMDLPAGSRPDLCRLQNAAVLANVERLGVRQAVLIANWKGYVWPSHGGAGWLRDRMADTVGRLEARGVEVAVAGPLPNYPAPVPSAVFRMSRFGFAPSFETSRPALEAQYQPITAALSASGATLLPLLDALCDVERCLIEKGGAPLYSDGNHLNDFGAALIRPMAEALLRAPSFASAELVARGGVD